MIKVLLVRWVNYSIHVSSRFSRLYGLKCIHLKAGIWISK